MNRRRHGSKPTIALWMLIAIADLAILVAATGVVTMLLIVAGLVALAGGVVAARALTHRPAGAGKAVARPRA
jgi:fatty acid desaturase